MAKFESELNWHSEANDVRLNPRWPQEDLRQLQELAQWATQEQNLTGHVWVSTSGTTSENIAGIKLVALSKTAFLSSAQAVNRHLQSDERDVWAQVLPLFHVGGLGIEARAFLSGAKTVRALPHDKWDPHVYYQSLRQNQCTLSSLVPTQVYDLVEAGYEAPPRLRALIVGGGALSLDLYGRARKKAWPLLLSYGMTETCSQIATSSLSSLQSLETPSLELLPHAHVRLDQEGYLEIQGPSLLTGYARWQQGEKKYWDPKHQNWFRSEDKALVSGRQLTILGRDQDQVKIGGESVALARLREKLETAVQQECSTWAQEFVLQAEASERLGHEIVLFVSRRVSAAQIENVMQSYHATVLPFEKIRYVYRVDEIPRSELGKVLVAQLRRKAKEE